MSGLRTPTEFLSFPVCGGCGLDFDEDKRKPRLLPCQHAFCTSCLNDQEDNDRQRCSTCEESWSHQNVTRLPVVYDLIPPGEDGTGRKVVVDKRKRSGATGREGTSAETDEKMDTGREVTPIVDTRSPATQDKSLSTARFPACNVCSEDFNINSQRPLKLPCGHCFCQSCLEVLRNSTKSVCPKCRNDWTKDDMNKLPIVKSLIHHSNTHKNVPREPSLAGNGKSDDDVVKAAEMLYLSNRTQNKQQTQTKSEIYVTDTQNRTHTLPVDLQRTTVTQLRIRIQEVTGVQPQAQRLLHNSRQLEDGHTLAHYGIQAYSRITLTCRLRGGTV